MMRRGRPQSLSGLAGLAGGLACSVAMTLAALGLAGAGASTVGTMQGMGSMSGTSNGRNTVLAFLIDNGRLILVGSIVLVLIPLLLWRWPAAVAAAAGGALMYWGMYVQSDITLMYVTMAIGLAGWVALILASRLRRVRTVRALK